MSKFRDIASKRAKRKVEPVDPGPAPLRNGDVIFYNPWSEAAGPRPSPDQAFAEGQLALAELYARQQAERDRERGDNDA